MVMLFCRRVRFYSPGDEAAFFSWVNSIVGVGSTLGDGHAIVLQVTLDLSDESLRELLAAFHRYDVDMKQLAQFTTPSNAAWFAEPNAYWHNRVFS